MCNTYFSLEPPEVENASMDGMRWTVVTTFGANSRTMLKYTPISVEQQLGVFGHRGTARTARTARREADCRRPASGAAVRTTFGQCSLYRHHNVVISLLKWINSCSWRIGLHVRTRLLSVPGTWGHHSVL